MTTSARTLTTATFDEEIAKRGPLLVTFYADHCTKCQAAAPLLERIGADFAGRLRTAKVDVAASPELKDRFEVKAGPTVVLFAHGVESGRVAGLVDDAAFRALAARGLEPAARAGS